MYAGAGREADYEIEGIIERSSYPTRLLVVSSDKRIAKAARKRHAPYLKSEGFLRQLALDADRRHAEPMPKWVHEIPLAKASVEHWLETFGIDTAQPLPDFSSVRTHGDHTPSNHSSPESDLISRGLEAIEDMDRPDHGPTIQPPTPQSPLPKLTLGGPTPAPMKSPPPSGESKKSPPKSGPQTGPQTSPQTSRKPDKASKSRRSDTPGSPSRPQRPSLPDAEELRRLAMEQGIDLDAMGDQPDAER